MIAEIYPVVRLPRRFGVFDYRVPEGMALCRGDMVRVPLRGITRLGVVAAVKEVTAVRALRDIESHLSDETVPEVDLAVYEALAVDLAQSVSTMLLAALPPRPARASSNVTAPFPSRPLSIPSDEAATVSALAQRMAAARHAYGFVPDLRRACAVVSRTLSDPRDGATLILCPNVRDAQICVQALSTHHAKLVDGEESPAARFAAHDAFRRDPNGLLVATRMGALYPHPKLGRIFVLRSGHENHKQADRNPRLDARDVARRRAAAHNASLIFLDVLPRADELDADAFGRVPMEGTTLVSLADERVGASHRRISLTIERHVTETVEAGGRVLCAYNHKGVSARLHCVDCGLEVPCPRCGAPRVAYETQLRCHRCGDVQPLPLVCAGCQGTNLQRRGHGNRSVADAIARFLPDARVDIVDRDTNPQGSTAQVVVTTSHYLENLFDPFAPEHFDLVVLLDADTPLYDPTFRATEHAFRRLEEWRGVAHALRAPFLIQTEVPDLFSAYLADPLAAMHAEREARRQYGLPPFSRIVRLHARGTEAQTPLAAFVAETDRGEGMAFHMDDRDAKAMVAIEAFPRLVPRLRDLPDGITIDTNAIS